MVANNIGNWWANTWPSLAVGVENAVGAYGLGNWRNPDSRYAQGRSPTVNFFRSDAKSTLGGNQGPVNDSPWRPGGKWYNRPVRPSSSQTSNTGNGGPVFGGQTYGGQTIGGQTFDFTPPAFQMPEINIPTFSAPKAPEVKKLSYKQLLSLINTDPLYNEAQADIRKNFREEKAAYGAQRESLEAQEVEDLRRQELDANEAWRQTIGQMAAGGTAWGSAREFQRARFDQARTRAEGDIERQYQNQYSDINRALAAIKRNKKTSLSNAKQDAINRYLGSRVQPTEITY